MRSILAVLVLMTAPAMAECLPQPDGNSLCTSPDGPMVLVDQDGALISVLETNPDDDPYGPQTFTRINPATGEVQHFVCGDYGCQALD